MKLKLLEGQRLYLTFTQCNVTRNNYLMTCAINGCTLRTFAFHLFRGFGKEKKVKKLTSRKQPILNKSLISICLQTDSFISWSPVHLIQFCYLYPLVSVVLIYILYYICNKCIAIIYHLLYSSKILIGMPPYKAMNMSAKL